MSNRLLVLFLCALPLFAHEGGQKSQKPTKAQTNLNLSKQKMAQAKRKLLAEGRYQCCVKPSCDLCARVNGSCACAENVANGKGACGECLAGWKAGRGSIKGVDDKSVTLFPAAEQVKPSEVSPELREAIDALINAKKILVSEKRFTCCIKGGCGQCAHEANCPCGADLAAGKSGVCGDCLDGWRSGQGSFAGIPASEVTLAPMEAMAENMGPGGGDSSGWYSSGTSQMPRAGPMNMLHWRVKNWSVMLSAQMFGVYTAQTGPRGRDKIFSANWAMAMASHRLGPGTLTLRSMVSLEPATITSRAYPLLFARGETANGIPIINGQHPHDLFMELGALYQIRVNERASLTFYGGPRGEPALGPTAYPHRASASENPIAVISHHLQDSTHIATNVVTAGVTYGPITWEVSGFHGREPDEQRWGIEGGKIDSLSTRLTITPTSRWSGQVSIGRLNHREATHPLRPSFRSTASATYIRPLSEGLWATTAIWGRNNDLEYTQLPQTSPGGTSLFDAAPPEPSGPIRTPILPLHIVTVPTRIPRQIYNSFLIESTFRRRNNWIWGRAENVDKDTTLLYEEAPFVLLLDERRYTRVQAYTAGYERELRGAGNWLKTGIGGQFTVFHAPPNLAPVYDSNPLGVQVFFRLRLGRTE